MKSLRVLISTLLVLMTLSFAACNRTADEQKDQNTTQQNATTPQGGGSPATPGNSNSSVEQNENVIFAEISQEIDSLISYRRRRHWDALEWLTNVRPRKVQAAATKKSKQATEN